MNLNIAGYEINISPDAMVAIIAILIIVVLIWFMAQQENYWRKRWDMEQCRNERMNRLCGELQKMTGWFTEVSGQLLLITSNQKPERNEPFAMRIWAGNIEEKWPNIEFRREKFPDTTISVSYNPNSPTDGIRQLVEQLCLQLPEHFTLPQPETAEEAAPS